MREKILLDDKWRFHLGDILCEFPKNKGLVYAQAKTERAKWGPAAYDYVDWSDPYFATQTTEKWEEVNLPHDYVVNQVPNENENNTLGYFKYENAWYRKHFTLNENDKNKRITLYFEGITSNSTIYINAIPVKRSFEGYTPFEVDITDFVMFDKENIIAVYVDTSNHEGWWYEGGGIYRHVWLIKTEKVAVDLWGVYVNPQKDKNSDDWNTSIETKVINESDKVQNAVVISDICDSSDKIIASAKDEITILPYDKSAINSCVCVKNPKLWDTENPNLYYVNTAVLTDGKEVDKVRTRFGFRTIEFESKNGFFLNGKKVKINGVCNHYGTSFTGKAMSDNLAKYIVSLLKEMGANAYRTSHYPHSEALMDAFDEEGILVMDEARHFSSSDEGKRLIKSLVKRDRNRPSVIMWSTGNEESMHCDVRGRKIQSSLCSVIKKLDKTRPVTTAVSVNPEIAPVYESCDIIGINYNLDKYDEIHKKFPDKMIFASECCATSTTRAHYGCTDEKRGYFPSYDHDTDSWFLGRENTYRFLNEKNYVGGSFQWSFIEHRGETKWPRLCSQAGAVDFFLQKKDAFYQNQAFWLEKDVLHLLPHWNLKGREGEEVDVFAYTNCDECELFLNGKSVGKQKTGRFNHGSWKVKYEPGVLCCIGYKNNKEVIRDTVETSGEAASLHLSSENKISEANGCDIAIIKCFCTDEKGRFVPDANPLIRFETNELGSVIATGSDVCDHTIQSSPDRKMRMGLCTASVRVGKISGTLKIYAHADNLKSARLEIKLK